MKAVRDLDTNNHSVFMLHYHLIMCTKYRREVIDDDDCFEYIILNKKSSEPVKAICATDYVYDKQLVNATYTGWKDCICEIRKNGQNLFSSQWFKLRVKENIVATIIAPYDE